jgi:hypothetical protein
VQARTAAGTACVVSAVSTAPDELAARVAEVAISPAAEAAAAIAATRRAVFGIVVRYFMFGRPVMAGDALFAASFYPLDCDDGSLVGSCSDVEPGQGRLVR